MFTTYERRRRTSAAPYVLLGGVTLLLLLCAYQLTRELPAAVSTTAFPATTVLGESRALPLPAVGASIVAVEGVGVLGASQPAAPRPIASVTKVMTAYVILKGHPLRPGEQGPIVTATSADAARYLQMILQDQSALPVAAGMQLSQYELLVGLLVPSANNFAEILASWDAGSVPAFVQKMNSQARALGMSSTTYADPSGFAAGNVSTPQDQLTLARAAMQDPVFASIVAMPEARIPGIGLVPAVNQALGQEGIVGIKTGLTEEAGGNLLFAARRQVSGQDVTVLGAAFNQDTRPLAFEASRRLAAAVGQGLQRTNVVSAGQAVGSVKSEWGDDVEVVAAEDAQMLLWPGMTLEAAVKIDAVRAPFDTATPVGTLTLRLGDQERQVPLQLAEPLKKAGLLWRLTRT